jgi:predicted deacylase
LIFVVDEIEKGTRGVRNLMAHLDMIAAREPVEPAKLLRDSYWIRVPPGHGGIYLPLVTLGSTVAKGEVLATIVDPVTDVVFEIQADQSGVVVGMALPQVVLSGYGLFHVGDAVVANE